MIKPTIDIPIPKNQKLVCSNKTIANSINNILNIREYLISLFFINWRVPIQI